MISDSPFIPSVFHVLIKGINKTVEIIMAPRILAILKKSQKLLIAIPFLKKTEPAIDNK